MEMQKMCTSPDSLRTKSRRFQPCSKVESPVYAPSQEEPGAFPEAAAALFALFAGAGTCCAAKKHLCYKLNWNDWLEMGSLAQRPDLLGIRIDGVISAAPTRLRLASRPGFGAAMPCM